MKIKFDGSQDFQLDAIHSVVDVFAGQTLTRASLQWQSDTLGGELLTEMGVGNSLALSDDLILKNVQKIHHRRSQRGDPRRRAESDRIYPSRPARGGARRAAESGDRTADKGHRKFKPALHAAVFGDTQGLFQSRLSARPSEGV
jgi:hypothetical protein